ncbi:MAG: polyphenol oxidase family protein [Treponema sp.]|jgi:YfiH family protein|nr:polyphenol oxidase family protein [Treponema sp.]
MIYSFKLEFPGAGHFASFPFIVDGRLAGGVSCRVSSRSAGDMVYSDETLTAEGKIAPGECNPARLSLFRLMNLDPALVFGLRQIHSREVLVVDRRGRPGVPADGMLSADRGIVLSVTAADCLPVFLYDTESGAFGLLHSGWRGTGIVLRALRLMAEQWRTRPEALAVVLGPCIGPCCYRVDEERAAAFEKEFGAGAVRREKAEGGKVEAGKAENGTRCCLDLKAANIALLEGAGVRNLAVCEDCTFTDERLGSFRREGRRYTHMAALAGYFDPPRFGESPGDTAIDSF